MGTMPCARTSTPDHDWVEAHAALTRLARERAAADAEEGRWLLYAFRAAVHVHLGHGSFAEYVERVFGYRARTTQEKLRVAEALENLPELARALDTGEVGWCAVRELTRVAVAETEDAWLAAARGKTIRQLEELVASKSPGDTPDQPEQPRPRSRVLRFEVAPETFALFRDALRALRRAAGGGLDDDAALLEMARHVLAGPGDAGRAPYQIALTVCDGCGRGEQLGGGEPVPIGAEVVAMAHCDAQHIGHLLPRAANENGASEPAATGQADDASEPAATAPANDASNPRAWAPVNDAHVDAPDRPGDGPGEAPAQSAAAAAPTAGATPPARVVPITRARQTIPPAVRRAVLARDRHRCRVPGCTHATFLDVHHIVPRSEGGSNDPLNLIGICSAHHRATHRGELLIESGPDASPLFRHADGSAYGNAVAPRVADAQAKVFAALRHLGFRERDVRAVLAELRADQALREATAERLLREALCRIRPSR
jgi:hypothetical protein